MTSSFLPPLYACLNFNFLFHRFRITHPWRHSTARVVDGDVGKSSR